MTSEGQNKKTLLYGLVLAGGKSQRMGHDKSSINWHGKEQKYFMADLLDHYCDRVFISCRKEQKADIEDSYASIEDSVDGSGPIIAMISAFAAFPEVGWLVVACDLPLLDEHTIRFLVSERNQSKMATTFYSPFDGLPEPLITIWEPVAKTLVLDSYDQGFKCPRKILIRNSGLVSILTPPDANALFNANTPEDSDKARVLLAGSDLSNARVAPFSTSKKEDN